LSFYLSNVCLFGDNARLSGVAASEAIDLIVLLSTTMSYTHILNKGSRGVRSPLDSG